MAIDELIYNAYKNIPGVKSIVDRIQKKHNVHDSQKGQPGYDEKNTPAATKEIEAAVAPLIEKYKGGLETKVASANPYSTQMKYAAALVLTLASLGLLATTGVYIPV